MKYGVEHQSKSIEIKFKTARTNLKKYGSKNVFQNEDIKEKSKQSRLKKYGVEHAMQSPSIREKAIQTHMHNKGRTAFGRDHYSEELLNAIDSGLKDVNSVHDAIFSKVAVSTSYLLLNKYRPDLVNNKSFSQPHKELSMYIESLGYEVENNVRYPLGGLEIDMYIPKLKIGFEFNGTFWHSSLMRHNEYHHEKSLLSRSKDIQLIHLYEFNGIEKNKEIIKEHLTNSYVPITIERGCMKLHPLDRGYISKHSDVILGEAIKQGSLVIYNSGYEVLDGSK